MIRTSLFALGVLLACAASSAHAALAPLDAVPRSTLAPAAIEAALRAHPSIEQPFRFAVPVAASLGLADGRWETDGASAVWRLRLHSAGAHSLSLHLAPLALPQDAELYVIEPATGFRQRPLLAGNVQPEGAWTALVQGEDLLLEARMPLAARAGFALGVAEVYHGYRDWKRAATAKSTSGACNIDVACSQGDAWRAEVRSVARLIFGGQFYCTGELLNNVKQDRAPLMVTADHCGIGTAEDDVADANSVNTYFDYQNATCGGGGTLPPTPKVSTYGATLLADDIQSDFTLLRLNSTGSSALPNDAYFAGWSALAQGSDSGVAIHHPAGDVKKISVYSTALTTAAADIGRACPVDAWQVQWNEGTTEPGSSGGGLWGATHHLIGTLSGGNASCDHAGGADYFARFERGWTANPSALHQLKAHLDPDGTCIAEIPGLDPIQQPNASPITSGPTRCEGAASSCDGHGGGGGGAVTFLPMMLFAFVLRLVIPSAARVIPSAARDLLVDPSSLTRLG